MNFKTHRISKGEKVNKLSQKSFDSLGLIEKLGLFVRKRRM